MNFKKSLLKIFIVHKNTNINLVEVAQLVERAFDRKVIEESEVEGSMPSLHTIAISLLKTRWPGVSPQ